MRKRYRLKDPMERFYSFMDVADNGCWLWNRGLSELGYATFSIRGQQILAHRFSHELFNGPIPKDYDVDHLCRARNCVNPEHLEAVTRRENNKRAPGVVSTLNTLKTKCQCGNEYDHIDYRGWRKCRACVRRIGRRSYHRRKVNA